MSDQFSPPPGPNWGSPPPSPGEPGSGNPPSGGQGWQGQPPTPNSWGSPPPPANQGSGDPPGGEQGWQAPPPAPAPNHWGSPPPPPSGAAPEGWGAPPPSQEPGWAPPPPPAPRPRDAEQSTWGAPEQPGPYPQWGGQQQPSWGQPAGYGAAPGYGAFAPPAPRRRGRFWIILSAVAAAVVVVLVAGTIGVVRLLGVGSVPPATGATVSTKFVKLKVASSWSETRTRSAEVELNNPGDGDMLVGYGNSHHDGITSDQSAFSNLQANLIANTGGSVRECVPRESVTVGGKSGQEEGFRYSFQGTDLCEIAWVDFVSSSRYYYWNIADDYSHLSRLRNDNSAMQETASWKV